MTIEQYIAEQVVWVNHYAGERDYLQAAKILEALAKEVKAHGMAMQHGVGKPFTAPRAQ